VSEAQGGRARANPGYAGLVLAAGRSTRMAEGSKLLSEFGDSTVICRVVATALAADLHPVVVVVGSDADSIRDSLSHLPVLFATVRGTAEGRLVSAVTGIKALAEHDLTGVMILLGDEPGLTEDQIRSIGRAPVAGAPIAWRARFRDRPGHPVLLPAPIVQSVPDLARRYGPDTGLWEIIVRSGLAHRDVFIDALAPIDVDTADDLARAVSRESAT
jgi:molybdenum cofactor cytidylyltransferase